MYSLSEWVSRVEPDRPVWVWDEFRLHKRNPVNLGYKMVIISSVAILCPTSEKEKISEKQVFSFQLLIYSTALFSVEHYKAATVNMDCDSYFSLTSSCFTVPFYSCVWYEWLNMAYLLSIS